MRRLGAFGLAAAFLAAAMLVSAFVGAADLNPLATATALLDKIPFVSLPSSLSPLDRAVLFQIRLPRVVLGALVGALLALAGAGDQGVFRNPLVDSGMLGASAGAGLGATLAIVDLSGAGPGVVPVAAFVGSLSGVAVAYLTGTVASRADRARRRRRDAAAGRDRGRQLPHRRADVPAAALSARTSRPSTAGCSGSLSAATWQQVTSILPYAAVSSVVILLHGRHLDVLAVGDEEARALGLRPAVVRTIVIAACALAAASAVAVSGLIGFVGIVVPHVARRLAGPSYTSVLPLSLLIGAGFLVLADTLARTVLSPAELPIGVVTALIGAPAFVWVLRGTRPVGT